MKTYNMAHLLVTRYSIKEDFGVNKSLEKIDGLESEMKEMKPTGKVFIDDEDDVNNF